MGAVASKLWTSSPEDGDPKPEQQRKKKKRSTRRRDPVVNRSSSKGVKTRSKAFSDSIVTRSKTRQSNKGIDRNKTQHKKRPGSPAESPSIRRTKGGKRSTSVDSDNIPSKEQSNHLTDDTTTIDASDSSSSSSSEDEPEQQSRRKRSRTISSSDQDSNQGITTRSKIVLNYTDTSTRKGKEVKRLKMVASPTPEDDSSAAKVMQSKPGTVLHPIRNTEKDIYAPKALDNPRAEELAFDDLKNEVMVEYREQKRQRDMYRDKQRDSCKRDFDADRVLLVLRSMRARADSRKEFYDKIDQRIATLTQALEKLREGASDEPS
ncbi:hypothetical protein BJV82DRAFT_357853 [Fennellomyces sp. T-0311]|nr:hypothetical protein BJV82DRAFT_357853 [Fennellomyces sp. T-0311]